MADGKHRDCPHRVSERVNRPRENGPELIEAIE
jgi:hypothetical protein